MAVIRKSTPLPLTPGNDRKPPLPLTPGNDRKPQSSSPKPSPHTHDQGSDDAHVIPTGVSPLHEFGHLGKDVTATYDTISIAVHHICPQDEKHWMALGFRCTRRKDEVFRVKDFRGMWTNKNGALAFRHIRMLDYTIDDAGRSIRCVQVQTEAYRLTTCQSKRHSHLGIKSLNKILQRIILDLMPASLAAVDLSTAGRHMRLARLDMAFDFFAKLDLLPHFAGAPFPRSRTYPKWRDKKNGKNVGSSLLWKSKENLSVSIYRKPLATKGVTPLIPHRLELRLLSGQLKTMCDDLPDGDHILIYTRNKGTRCVNLDDKIILQHAKRIIREKFNHKEYPRGRKKWMDMVRSADTAEAACKSITGKQERARMRSQWYAYRRSLWPNLFQTIFEPVRPKPMNRPRKP
jgi:hypothetical protein